MTTSIVFADMRGIKAHAKTLPSSSNSRGGNGWPTHMTRS